MCLLLPESNSGQPLDTNKVNTQPKVQLGSSDLKWQIYLFLKFIYSEKATKFCEISTVDLSYVVTVKSAVEISQNFVTFSEYMNFKAMQIFFKDRQNK